MSQTISCHECPVNHRCCSNVRTRTNYDDLQRIIDIGNRDFSHPTLPDLIVNLRDHPPEGVHHCSMSDQTITLVIIGYCAAFDLETGDCLVQDNPKLKPSFCNDTQEGGSICQ